MESRSRSAVKLAIDKNGRVPVYQQVVDGISEAVARGDLGRGARLPSVRLLAEDLGLNVNTVARAYRDLERAGVVDTMPGMGTFVAAEGQQRAHSVHASLRAIPATGAPLPRHATAAPLATSWRDLLAAAHALAVAEGVDDAHFAARPAELVGERMRAPFVACAPTGAEAAEILRALPAELAGLTMALPLDGLEERLTEGRTSAIITTFPAVAAVRARLGEPAGRVRVIPVETEFTEATVRALSSLPATARLALVTLDRSRWDEEANDVMKIVGRQRWLKMIVLDAGDRGLGSRLEHVDAVLFVPRDRDAVEPLERPGQVLVELSRQLTPRARERLSQAASALAD